MASYSELRALFSDDDLRNRVTTAVIIAAEAELSASPGTIEGRAWGLAALRDTAGWGRTAFISVLASNKSATVAAIQGASDVTIQTNIDTAKAGWIAAEGGV